MRKNILIFGIIILFILSSVSPLTTGRTETVKVDIGSERMVDDLPFICTGPSVFNNVKYEYHKGQNLSQYSSDNGNDIQEIFSSDGATEDRFGCSVSIDGDYALIGVEEDDDNGYYSGSAYIFKRNGTIWTEQSKLVPSDGDEREVFGVSVSIDGNYAIIGAPHDDHNGYYSGSAYIFKRNGTVWTEQSKLLPSDAKKDQQFGCSVAIDGEYAIIGALGDKIYGEYSGSAYIFKRNGTVWTEQSKLLPLDGGQFKVFGNSVSIDGGYAIIGAPGDNESGYGSGSAYIFKRNGTVWTEQSKLVPSDGEPYKSFGLESISINGNYAIIGARGNDDNGYRSGSAYIFKQDGNNWTQQVKLFPSNKGDIQYFGKYVSIDGDYAIIGAYGDIDNGKNAGSAYVFKCNGTTWSKHVKLLAPDGIKGDCFGWSVSIDGDSAIIGAMGADGNEPRSGSAYVFKNISEFQSPSIPLINGPTNGKLLIKYTFYFSAIDPDNDYIYYYIDWGDNTSNYWLGPFESGEEISASHRWFKQGNLKISIKVKNTMGVVGDWGTLTLIIPRDKAINNVYLPRFLERFSLLQRIMGGVRVK